MGLDLNSSPLAKPDFAQILDNCIINRDGLAQNRKGFNYVGTFNSALAAIFDYQNGLITFHANGTLRYTTNLTSFTTYTGTYTAPSSSVTAGTTVNTVTYPMLFAVEDGDFFFTNSLGVQRISGISSNPVRAGAPIALNTTLALSGTGGGFLNGNTQISYRIVWVRTTPSGRTITGAPSLMRTITNNNAQTLTSLTSAAGTATATTPNAHGFTTGDSITISGATQTQYNGTFTITVTSSTTYTYAVSGSPSSPATGTITSQKNLNVSVTFVVPFDVVSGDQWQIYRTHQSASPNASTTPPDDHYFVAQGTWTSGRTVTFTDNVLEANLQTGLYCNATNDGIGSFNYRPPLARDVAVFQDYTFFANCDLDQTLANTMIGTAGLVAGTSSLTLTRISDSTAATYTFANAENVGLRQFQLFTGGTPSQNLENTMRSFCNVVNQDPSGLWYVDYISSFLSVPGMISIRARQTGDGQFAMTCNSNPTGADFATVLPTSGTTVASSSGSSINGVYFSKFQQPDHVPLAQFIPVGRGDKRILRIVPIRNNLFIIKEDGIWIVIGTSASSFTLLIFDSSARCLSPASVQVVDNQAFMLSNQGVVSVSDGGVKIWSRQIEPAITPLLSFSNLYQCAFGARHEIERNYLLWLPTFSGDTIGTQCFIFNIIRQQWVRWTKSATCAYVNDTNRLLYIGSGSENALLGERSNGTTTDYRDETFTVTITGQTGTTVTMTTSSIWAPQVGSTLEQSTTYSKILTVTGSSSPYTVTIDRNVSYSNASASVSLPITSTILMNPDQVNNPGTVKAFLHVQAFLGPNQVSALTMKMGTNEQAAYSTQLVGRSNTSAGWGLDPWGTTPWGSTDQTLTTIPWRECVPVPGNTGETLTYGISHSVCDEPYALENFTVYYDDLSSIAAAN